MMQNNESPLQRRGAAFSNEERFTRRNSDASALEIGVYDKAPHNVSVLFRAAHLSFAWRTAMRDPF
jgi:hypothetical protein